MSFVKYAWAASLIVACSDASSSTSSGVSSSSGGPGTGSSGAPSTPPSTSSSGGPAGAIDLDSLVAITISSDWCDKPMGQCLDAQSFTVDFVSSELTNTTCIELGGAPDAGSGSNGTQDAKTTRPITAADLNVVKARLAALRTAGPGATADGGAFGYPSKTLEVKTTSRGTQLYQTADTLCASPSGIALSSGWDELWNTLRAM